MKIPERLHVNDIVEVLRHAGFPADFIGNRRECIYPTVERNVGKRPSRPNGYQEMIISGSLIDSGVDPAAVRAALFAYGYCAEYASGPLLSNNDLNIARDVLLSVELAKERDIASHSVSEELTKTSRYNAGIIVESTLTSKRRAFINITNDGTIPDEVVIFSEPVETDGYRVGGYFHVGAKSSRMVSIQYAKMLLHQMPLKEESALSVKEALAREGFVYGHGEYRLRFHSQDDRSINIATPKKPHPGTSESPAEMTARALDVLHKAGYLAAITNGGEMIRIYRTVPEPTMQCEVCGKNKPVRICAITAFSIVLCEACAELPEAQQESMYRARNEEPDEFAVAKQTSITREAPMLLDTIHRRNDPAAYGVPDNDWVRFDIHAETGIIVRVGVEGVPFPLCRVIQEARNDFRVVLFTDAKTISDIGVLTPTQRDGIEYAKEYLAAAARRPAGTPLPDFQKPATVFEKIDTTEKTTVVKLTGSPTPYAIVEHGGIPGLSVTEDAGEVDAWFVYVVRSTSPEPSPQYYGHRKDKAGALVLARTALFSGNGLTNVGIPIAVAEPDAREYGLRTLWTEIQKWAQRSGHNLAACAGLDANDPRFFEALQKLHIDLEAMDEKVVTMMQALSRRSRERGSAQ